MHPDDDELLQVLEGEMWVTLLTDDGPVETQVPAGSLFVVPRGCWHKQRIPVRTCELYVTPGKSLHSTDDDPRTEKENDR
jgi:mannose-6-phosphate isomerase-like protein (cupin superfamily)